MPKYVAFLRAINVGGSKIIKMDDLRQKFESQGLLNVQTFIQSGNVIFEVKGKGSTTLENKIESQLEKALGSIDEITAIVNQTRLEPQGDETLYVTFLRGVPTKAQAEALKPYNSPADEFAIAGREVYNLRHNREQSVFSNNFMEKIFGVATTRNMTTIRKIFEKYNP
jgi:uncharacterized protein (DUF1697 family)